MNRKDSGETSAAGKFAGDRKPPPKLAGGDRKFRRTQPLDCQRPEASPYAQKLENPEEPVETNKLTTGEGAAGGSRRPKVHRTSGNPPMTTPGTRTSPVSSWDRDLSLDTEKRETGGWGRGVEVASGWPIDDWRRWYDGDKGVARLWWPARERNGRGGSASGRRSCESVFQREEPAEGSRHDPVVLGTLCQGLKAQSLRFARAFDLQANRRWFRVSRRVKHAIEGRFPKILDPVLVDRRCRLRVGGRWWPTGLGGGVEVLWCATRVFSLCTAPAESIDYFSARLKGTDALVHLHAYWARLELSLAKDIVAARGVWESLLKICGSMLEAWKGYIAMEIENGNLNEARSIYRRCYTKRFPGTGSEDLCQSWLRFEREFGTLEDYDHAVQKVMGGKLKWFVTFSVGDARKIEVVCDIFSGQDTRQFLSMSIAAQSKADEVSLEVSPRLEELHMFSLQQESKAVAISGEAKEHSSKKKSREKRKPSSNLYEDQTPPKRQKETRQSFKKGSKKDDDKEQGVSGTNKTEETEANFDKQENSHLKLEKDSINEKAKYTDQCTAFISNLSLNLIVQANYERLRNFFSDVGGVQSIRILKDKYTGKPRGLAYVDFCDDAHLEAAVAKNKEFLLGKKLSIARSDPALSKKRGSGGRHNADEEGGKNLPGDPARPKRNDSAELTRDSAAQSSSKSCERDGIQLKGKNTFALPRNVRPLGWTANKPKAVESGEDEKPKSNDEFRQMLLKK
ncbi:hypothetical protein Cgig2_027868 [Carnegiea gigantea]|uniref:RRM domain-containing protein n=1 Tax=Carnegiea gigantea TaxID=171969 RepID=A0A9Q1KND5_9CARY|nr:hypothetical protein Cgig2_027868 [Carnegiea gigantea]